MSYPPHDQGTPPPPPEPPGYPPSYPPPGYPPPYQPGYSAYGYQPYPVQQNHPQATTAMVLGIVGIAGGMVCGLPLVVAPFAWVMGKRAMNEIDASSGTFGGRGQAQAGFVLGIIGTVLLGLSLVGILWFLFVIGLAASST